MKFSVSEVARALEVDRDLIKKWAYLFHEYLKAPANPSKGNPRQFCVEDLRVLAYISMYWEDYPDMESIRSGLNAEEYYDDIYNNFMTSVTPLFMDPPDELNEDWRHGALIGGMAEIGDTFALADSYKLAGDMLVESALSNDDSFELICPIIYNYRHATELYLKATLPRAKKNHDILILLQEFKKLIKSEFNTALPDWFEGVILALNDFDPRGTTFRYGGDIPGEVWADIVHIKTLIGWMADSFQKIKIQKGRS